MVNLTGDPGNVDALISGNVWRLLVVIDLDSWTLRTACDIAESLRKIFAEDAKVQIYFMLKFWTTTSI